MLAGDVAGRQLIRFPPRWQHVLVPVRPRGAAALGTTLYTASRPRPLLAQQVLWALARVGGGRLLPGPRETWQPPLHPAAWAALWDDWTGLLGRIDGVAVYSRPQASRTGLVLLLWQPARATVVRLRRDPAALAREQALAAGAPAAFRIPRVLGRGGRYGWHWLAAEAMSRRPHRPVLALPPGLAVGVEATVSRALTAPVGTPSHWRPAHGDLTPWNLRRAGGQTWLIDWEDAGWAPPHADAVYFDATVATLARTSRAVDVAGARAEAAAYWLEQVGRRSPTDADADLSVRLSTALRGG